MCLLVNCGLALAIEMPSKCLFYLFLDEAVVVDNTGQRSQ